jgi:hypothetical protein
MNPEASAETRLAAARRALARDEAEKRLAAALRAALESAAPPAPPPPPDEWEARLLESIARDAAGRRVRRLGVAVLLFAGGATATFLLAMAANAPEIAASATDWRGLIPLGMAAAIPCGLLAAAIGIPIARRREARRAREKARAAREALEGAPGRFRRTDLGRAPARIRLPSREKRPRWWRWGT